MYFPFQKTAVCFAASVAVLGTPFLSASVDAHPAVLGQKEDGDKKDSTKPPFQGMTKAQARQAYGEPDSVGHRDGEELWTYVLNRGENYAKSLIPFGPSSKLRYRLLTFKDGKVVDFHWDAPNKD